MTICIAVICSIPNEDTSGTGPPRIPMIFAVSDRQYTVGDHWKFEPQFTKHVSYGVHCVALFSGDVSECTSICQDAAVRVGYPVKRNTKFVANRLADAYAEYRRSEAERVLLLPIGLTMDTLLKDGSLTEVHVTNLIADLQRHRLKNTFIVAGTDSDWNAHLYAVEDPGLPRCADTPGFLAVGSGAEHASALFLRQSYTWSWSPARAIFLAYAAKRHAEVDPHVGTTTDIYVIGPGNIPYSQFSDQLRDQLEVVYEESRKNELKASGDAYADYEKFVEETLAEHTAKPVQHGAATPEQPQQ